MHACMCVCVCYAYRVAAQKKNVDLQRKLKVATKVVIRNAATSQSIELFVDNKTPPNITKHLLKKVRSRPCVSASRT